MKRTLVLLFAMVFMCGAAALAFDSVSAEEILKKTNEQEKKMSVERSKYTYHWHKEVHKAGKDGKSGSLVRSEDYDIIVLGNRPFCKLLLRNGKPLDSKEAEQVQADMKKASERNQQQQSSKQTGTDEYRPLQGRVNPGTLPDMLRLMNNTVLREEELNGRKAWVLQSEPRKDAVSTSPRDEEILSYRQLFWIDQQDSVIAQREIRVIREIKGQRPAVGGTQRKPGSFIRWTYAKEGDTDWLLRTNFGFVVSNHNAGSLAFGNPKWVEEYTYSNYKKFNVQTNITFDPNQE